MKKITATLAAVAAAGLLGIQAAPPPSPAHGGNGPKPEMRGEPKHGDRDKGIPCRACGGDGYRRAWYGGRRKCEVCHGDGILSKSDAHGPQPPSPKHEAFREKQRKHHENHVVSPKPPMPKPHTAPQPPQPAQPVVVQPAPVVVQPQQQPVVVQPAPVVVQPQPQPQPVVVQPKPPAAPPPHGQHPHDGKPPHHNR